MSFEEGDLVTVRKPHKNYNGEWLLPGEKIYVISYPTNQAVGSPDRVRVRCPASGADMWVDKDILELVESAKPVVEPESVSEDDLWLLRYFWAEDNHAGGVRKVSIRGDVLNVHIRREQPNNYITDFEERYFRLVPIDDPDKETDD